MSRYISTIVSDRQGEYLGTMIRTGLYGQDLDQVVSGLIAVGIQRAVEIGALDVAFDPLPDIEEAPPVAVDLEEGEPF